MSPISVLKSVVFLKSKLVKVEVKVFMYFYYFHINIAGGKKRIDPKIEAQNHQTASIINLAMLLRKLNGKYDQLIIFCK